MAHNHVEYRGGKSAHAAAYPDQGVNANDAFIVAQVALGLLRQQLPSGTRVHGIQTRGGEAPNAIPEKTEGRWYVRAESLALLGELEERVQRCFEAGGALASGCELSVTPESEPYSEFRTDLRALELYVRHAEALGRDFNAPPEQATMNRASTDMGNVSQVVPAIHPYIGLGCFPAANHQPEFAAHCVGDAANLAIHDGAAPWHSRHWTTWHRSQGVRRRGHFQEQDHDRTSSTFSLHGSTTRARQPRGDADVPEASYWGGISTLRAVDNFPRQRTNHRHPAFPHLEPGCREILSSKGKRKPGPPSSGQIRSHPKGFLGSHGWPAG